MNKKYIISIVVASGLNAFFSQAYAEVKVYTDRSAWEFDALALGLTVSATEMFDSLVGSNFRGGTTLNLSSVSLCLSHANTTTSLNDNSVEPGSSPSFANVNGTAYFRVDDNPGNLQMAAFKRFGTGDP